MITMAVVIVLGIASYVAAENGEWGAVAVGAVLILLLLGIRSQGRKSDRAYVNFVDHWQERR